MPDKYANIAFNLPVDSLFTYTIPHGIAGELKLGSRVLAPFGKRNITGVVLEFPEHSELKKIKPIIEVLDAEPVVSAEMIDFCKWISQYYICPPRRSNFFGNPKRDFN